MYDVWIISQNYYQKIKKGEIKKEEEPKAQSTRGPNHAEKPLSMLQILVHPFPDSLTSPDLHPMISSAFLKLGYEHYYIFKDLLSQFSSFSPFSHQK